jgi:hypothetical protein
MEKERLIDANMFNNQSQTADKRDPPDIGWAIELEIYAL